MKVISLRDGFECDHSTRDYGYISGIRVYYDYGVFDMTFMIPYDTELFKLLKRYKNLNIDKNFNKIVINLLLYCEDLNEEEYEYVDLFKRIIRAIKNKNEEVLKILDMYHNEDDDYLKLKAKTELGQYLQKVLTL